MAIGNPAMNEMVYQRSGRAFAGARVMTIEGTALKAGLLTIILAATATFTWTQATHGSELVTPLLLIGALGGFATSLVANFFPRSSPVIAPVYAGLEGLALGAISWMFERRYPGVVMNAVGLSVGVLAGMLFLYGTRMVQATDRFRTGILAAIGGVCLVYIVDMIAMLFHHPLPFIHQSGPLGIAFSAVVVVIAAASLILNFDFIEKGARFQAPKYMEWYGAFSLLVTLVWMYMEILRLLSKLRSRD